MGGVGEGNQGRGGSQHAEAGRVARRCSDVRHTCLAWERLTRATTAVGDTASQPESHRDCCARAGCRCGAGAVQVRTRYV